MRKRKLVTRPTLTKIATDVDRGVPVARAMRNHGISMARPSIVKLLKVRAHHSSLYPDWLVVDEQEQPDNTTYIGRWPEGEWVWTR